jgi:hypothetical protein
MKMSKKLWIGLVVLVTMQAHTGFAQVIDEDRMVRDIEVAENVLSTLIKQEINTQRGFFSVDIKGTYLQGYGVTFRLPADFIGHFLLAFPPDGNAVIYNSDRNGFHYSISTDEDGNAYSDTPQIAGEDEEEENTMTLRDRTRQKRAADKDSARNEYNMKVIKAAKDFIVDYGDFVSQLAPNERIVVTNQGQHGYFSSGRRTHISVEGQKSDITAFKQGKMTRDQVLAKLKVINTESVNEKLPDMELISSIFSRLYRSDLSRTFFTDDNIYYEVLKDYGVMYYMQVYSGVDSGYERYTMPTVNLKDVDKETRNKKIIELYPKFEQEMKENILEYGRTIKSLKPDEVVVFNITLTKCKGCGIPSTLELSVKNSVLQDYGSGKLDKNAALSKFIVKKGEGQ